MNEAGEIIRVLVADDHPPLRAGLCVILESASDIRVVGEANDGTEAQQMTARLRPQVLLLDMRMPGPGPNETITWVRTHSPETTVLVLTAYDEDAFLSAMVATGAADYILKEAAPEVIVQAVHNAARGEVFFTAAQLRRVHRWREEVGARWDSLTKREREVLRLLAAGGTNAELARQLGIRPKTVESHVSHVLSKLGVASRLEAVVWAKDAGLEAELREPGENPDTELREIPR